MILIVGAWYNQVGYSFNFSHKVDLFIRERIISDVFTKYGLDIINDGWYLNLVVATDSSITQVEVRGPKNRKRAKMIDFGLWFPHDEIMKSECPLDKYIDCFFDALVLVFINYNVKSDDILDLKSISKKEILNNPNYC